ncbi:MAG: hypothetical protein CMJ24_04410 [Phycisphaerae bacterium]|nr:hypothetical protein [Phycisphaerae bacterium]|tara:strand:+ start:180 stop:1037 length:858 start_codon:yes stop_codon:yes gene_type:complete
MTVSVQDLHVHLASNHVLRGMDFMIEPGERVAILGPNGCGKSTLLRALCGIVTPSSGAVELEGTRLPSHRRRDRAKMIGLLPQSDIIPMMTTVRDHVAIGRHPYRRYFRQGGVDDRSCIDRAIELCEIGHLEDRPVERLSGGERQRVRLATLLSQAPSILLLDEPLTGLDLQHQYALLHLLEDMNRDEGRTVIVVLHDLSIAMRFFDRILVLQDGLLVADGAPDRIMTKQLLREVFNVEASIGRDSISNHPVIACHRNGSARSRSVPDAGSGAAIEVSTQEPAST